MRTRVSVYRLVAAAIVSAVSAALALTLALHFAAHGAAPQLPTVAQVLGMSAFFSLFTLPVALALAWPVAWLWRRMGPLALGKCALLGAIAGVLGGYGLLLLAFVPTPGWTATLWFAAAGAAAGMAMGRVLGGDAAPDTASRGAAVL